MYYFEVEFLAIPDNVTIFLGYLNVNHTAGRLFDSRSWAFSKNEDGIKSRLVEYNDGFRQNHEELDEHFEKGDVIGCGYSWEQEKVFFTKNGKRLRKCNFLPTRKPVHCALTSLDRY